MSILAVQKGTEPWRKKCLNTLLSLMSGAVLWFLSRSQAPSQAALLKPTLVFCKTTKEITSQWQQTIPSTLPSVCHSLKTEWAR